MCIAPSGPLADNTERVAVLKALEECVSTIERSGIVSALMPQVSMNLVYSLAKPKSISDVAGIPGRIVKTSGRVTAVGRPTFGGSQHLASVLLVVNARDPRIRAAINIRNDGLVKSIARSSGYTYAIAQHTVEPISEASIIESVANAFPRGAEQPILIFHEGGMGYEPATYIFGYSPQDVTKTVLEIGRKYLAGYSQT
jgi:predicted fused transcriptional regulator/phosphomethylpyrimidine kinase